MNKGLGEALGRTPMRATVTRSERGRMQQKARGWAVLWRKGSARLSHHGGGE